MMSELYNEDYLICSPSYSEILNGIVLPWLSDRENAAEIQGADHRPLYCVSYQAEEPLATVVIVHGFTENAFKYAELIWSLLHCRYSVIAFDMYLVLISIEKADDTLIYSNTSLYRKQ